MHVKKPLLLVVVTAVLLAVALLLPAETLGKQPVDPNANQPLNWVVSGENSNNDLFEIGYQGGHSVLVKELSDLSLVGRVTLQTMKELVGRSRLTTTQMSAWDPIDRVLLDVFRTENGKKVAEFVALFDMGLDPGGTPIVLPVKIKLVDGGEPPKRSDEEYYYLPAVTGGWERYGGEDAPANSIGNIQIHIGE